MQFKYRMHFSFASVFGLLTFPLSGCFSPEIVSANLNSSPPSHLSSNTITPSPTPTLSVIPSSRTILGCFNVLDLSDVQEINAQAVRVIFSASNLPNYLNGPWKGTIAKIQTLYNAGIKVIVTIAWNGGNKTNPPPALPEVGSTAYDNNINLWIQFLTTVGPYLYGVTLENEPTSDYAPSDLTGTSPNAITWFQTLAREAATLRTTNPNLSNLLIGTPALNQLAALLDNGTPLDPYPSLSPNWASTLTDFDQAFFAWATSDPNIDFIDTHAHVMSAEDITTIFTYVSQQNKSAHKKLMSTEWSQALVTSTWLTQTPSVQSAKNNSAYDAYLAGAPSTNASYISFLETNPTDLQTWNALIATAPFDSTFMSQAFEIMNSFGLTAAFYGGYSQYGNSMFDTDELYANMSVALLNGNAQPNFNFLAWFEILSR